MNTDTPIVYVVDDDPAILQSLAELFGQLQSAEVRIFDTAEAFYREIKPTRPGCLVLDLRMPGATGMSVLDRLKRDGAPLPTVIVTAFGDVSSAVQAMKAGAIDFLEKPFDPQTLLQLAEEGIEKSRQMISDQTHRDGLVDALKTLTPREYEVLEHLNSGISNKQTAFKLDISDKTVSAHRTAILAKFRINSTTELVRRLAQARIQLHDHRPPPGSA